MERVNAEIAEMLRDSNVQVRLDAVRRFTEPEIFPADLYRLALGDEDWRVRKEAANQFIQSRAAEKQAGFLIDLLQHPDNAGLRNAAIEILIGLGATAIPVLVHRLPTEGAEVRKFIVDILGEIGHPSCIDNLLPHLQDADANVQYAVVETLGKLRAETAVDSLLDLLDQADVGLRFTIFEALAVIGANVPVARIAQFAEDRLLRKVVYSCLGRLGEVQSLPLLVAGTADPLRKSREAALLAIGGLIEKLAATIPLPEVPMDHGDFDQLILEFLGQEDPSFRRAACYALCLRPTREALWKILPLLADEGLRSDVVAACRRMPESLLLSLLEDAAPEGEVAPYLIYLFGELQRREILPLAEAGLQADKSQLRYISILTLGKIGALRSIPLLGGRFLDSVPEIREAAAESLRLLGALAPKEVADVLGPFLESNDSGLRLLAVRTLGSLPAEKVEDSLLLALKDYAPEVRCEALRSLKGLVSPRLISGLSLALIDEIADVRRLAAEALGAFPPQRVMSILASAAEDQDPWVRMSAFRSISGGDEKSVEALLRKGVADEVGMVVIAALDTLARLLPDRAGKYFCQALENSDPEVVATAVRLLLADGQGFQLLTHGSAAVRLAAIQELERQEAKIWTGWFADCLNSENDPQVRAALATALRRGRAGE